MMRRLALLLLCILVAGCDSQPASFCLFTKGKMVPQVIFTDAELKGAAESFCRLFEEATGEHLSPAVSASASAGTVISIALYKNDDRADGQFQIAQQDNRVYIKGARKDDVDSGIHYFFSHFVHMEAKTEGLKSTARVKEIIIPSGLNYSQEYAFKYREPYFPDNFSPDFRKWNNTHTLEEHWGLWGHNIGKVIAITAPMHATVNGKKNDDQLCFSSPELEASLIAFIENKSTESPMQDKFMIMPYDNHLVCRCSKCTAAGNTETNASPAVFSLMNRLAQKFPKQEFFSTSYITTQTPPKFRLAPNAGVMVSTMQFPKGVVIEKNGKKTEIERTFAGWKAITNKIYLWDYAVNFDNYFDAYPTVSIAQQNLEFYKKLGVTGVFMHGSEEYYSAFASLKCYLYAQLLQDLDVNIEELAKEFYTKRYPAAADVLTSYYLTQEKRAFESPRQLDIYGGIAQSEKKYLDALAFRVFYDKLTERVNSLSVSETAAIEPLMAALTFQRLELMRIHGLAEGGYGNIKNGVVSIDPQINILLDRLAAYCAESDIKIYNESNFTVNDYVRAWRSQILQGGYRNLMYGKRLRFTGTPDEEYADSRKLTDGAVGFTDYYNNWILSTAGELAVEANVEDAENVQYIEMGFLNDPCHNIYLPEKVVVTIGARSFEAKLSAESGKKTLRKSVKIPVTVLPTDKTITIQTVKQADFRNKSVACDEVYFK